ncbi:hypothetical protein RFI_28861 [Reticulomyxa filosa]|uniref:Uncharacterized protein n=1 Tax=Reticulomyxa filosa TaxID=46433 RepID=X6M4G2_RETFI|nr:hypothetical protein RFI_28861 [Reticulomyxa filosa]|eukprot:ETO08526.1 hypothetical protein RFI_28861 [Reticulomyxa filosa]
MESSMTNLFRESTENWSFDTVIVHLKHNSKILTSLVEYLDAKLNSDTKQLENSIDINQFNPAFLSRILMALSFIPYSDKFHFINSLKNLVLLGQNSNNEWEWLRFVLSLHDKETQVQDSVAPNNTFSTGTETIAIKEFMLPNWAASLVPSQISKDDDRLNVVESVTFKRPAYLLDQATTFGKKKKYFT